MLPEIAAAHGSGRMRGFLQSAAQQEEFELGGCRLRVNWNRPYDPARPPAGGLVIAREDYSFFVAGYGFWIDLFPAAGQGGAIDFLEIWEGDFRAGAFVRGRRLNGDEYMLRLGPPPGVLQARVYRYE